MLNTPPLFPSLNTPNFDFLTPVIVRPSERQIENATEVMLYSSIENPQNRSCPITMAPFQSEDNVRRIKYCGHIYNDESLITWFRSNVRCPLCRYDIRNYIAGRNMNSENGNEGENESESRNEGENRNESESENELNNEDLTENISLVRTLSHDQDRSGIDISDNNTSLLNFDISNNNAHTNITPIQPTNNNNINLQDSLMTTLANRMADEYMNNMSSSNPTIAQGLQEGNVALEYTIYTPFNNTFYTARRNNQDLSNNDVNNNQHNENNENNENNR